jgi:hypothetical protein
VVVTPQAEHYDELIKRSYQLLSLLDVAVQSAHWIADQGQGNTPPDAGSLAWTLQLASDIAGEIHDALEKGELAQKAA